MMSMPTGVAQVLRWWNSDDLKHYQFKKTGLIFLQKVLPIFHANLYVV
jgi:hypothetical protein